MGIKWYTRTISSNAIDTNRKQFIEISATGDLYNIYPVVTGTEVTLMAASGATVTISGSSGNIKMTGSFSLGQYDTVTFKVEPSGAYWIPSGGKNNNA